MRPLDLRVVLTRPLYERNIGAAARAAQNMGATALVLIDPKCAIEDEARMAAATALRECSAVAS